MGDMHRSNSATQIPVRQTSKSERHSGLHAFDLEPPLPIERISVRIPVAIEMTGIGRSKLYELIAANEVQSVKIGRSTLILVDSLHRLIERSGK